MMETKLYYFNYSLLILTNLSEIYKTTENKIEIFKM